MNASDWVLVVGHGYLYVGIGIPKKIPFQSAFCRIIQLSYQTCRESFILYANDTRTHLFSKRLIDESSIVKIRIHATKVNAYNSYNNYSASEDG